MAAGSLPGFEGLTEAQRYPWSLTPLLPSRKGNSSLMPISMLQLVDCLYRYR